MIACRPSLILLSLLLLGGCVGAEQRSTAPQGRAFQVEDLAKSDVDMVAEIQLRTLMGLLETLAEKLYLRNPREWQKGGDGSREAAVARIFSTSSDFPSLEGRRGVEGIRLAFEPGYSGDRVQAMMVGLRGMILRAYNDKQAFYLTDELDPQKLYNAARNLEITVWMLSHKRDDQGVLFLISNETGGEIDNLSYERLFGKLIALQDSMALIIAESSNRQIKHVIQTVASMVFLPI